MFVSMVENSFCLYACLVVIRLPINFQHTVCKLSTNLSELEYNFLNNYYQYVWVLFIGVINHYE